MRRHEIFLHLRQKSLHTQSLSGTSLRMNSPSYFWVYSAFQEVPGYEIDVFELPAGWGRATFYFSSQCGPWTRSSSSSVWELIRNGHPRPLESDTLKVGGGPSIRVFNSPSRGFPCLLKSESHCSTNFDTLLSLTASEWLP